MIGDINGIVEQIVV